MADVTSPPHSPSGQPDDPAERAGRRADRAESLAERLAQDAYKTFVVSAYAVLRHPETPRGTFLENLASGQPTPFDDQIRSGPPEGRRMLDAILAARRHRGGELTPDTVNAELAKTDGPPLDFRAYLSPRRGELAPDPSAAEVWLTTFSQFRSAGGDAMAAAIGALHAERIGPAAERTEPRKVPRVSPAMTAALPAQAALQAGSPSPAWAALAFAIPTAPHLRTARRSGAAAAPDSESAAEPAAAEGVVGRRTPTGQKRALEAKTLSHRMN